MTGPGPCRKRFARISPGRGAGGRPASASASRRAARARWRRMRSAPARDAEGGGGLGRRLADRVAQGDLALAGRQGPQRPGQHAAELAAAGLLVGVVGVGRGDRLQGVRRRRTPSAREPARLVAGDHRQPGRDVARRHPADRRQGPQPRLLDGVVGVVAGLPRMSAQRRRRRASWRATRLRQRGVVAVAGGEREAARRCRRRRRRSLAGRSRTAGAGACRDPARRISSSSASALMMISPRPWSLEGGGAAGIPRGARAPGRPRSVTRTSAAAPPASTDRDLERRAGQRAVLDRVGEGLVDREHGELHALAAPAGAQQLLPHRVAAPGERGAARRRVAGRRGCGWAGRSACRHG